MSLSIKEAAPFAQTPGECGMELPNPDRLAEQPGAVKLPGGKKGASRPLARAEYACCSGFGRRAGEGLPPDACVPSVHTVPPPEPKKLSGRPP